MDRPRPRLQPKETEPPHYTSDHLQTPFVYFGGKAKTAAAVWQRFGDVDSYVEPFFGSGANLLRRPTKPRIEVVNDLDHFVANFWRALKADPDGLAEAVEWPINQTDMRARNFWLMNDGKAAILRCSTDPDYYNTKVAAWWCWGMCTSIFNTWCRPGPWVATPEGWVNRPGQNGVGNGRPHMTARQGIHRPIVTDTPNGMRTWMRSLAARMRHVIVCNGDWSNVVQHVCTTYHGIAGVFLDPPYSAESGRSSTLYAQESLTVAHDVRAWCIANGNNPKMRIALCGYDNEHDLPKDWFMYRWQSSPGVQRGANKADPTILNSERECIWFSPHCLKSHDQPLF